MKAIFLNFTFLLIFKLGFAQPVISQEAIADKQNN